LVARVDMPFALSERDIVMADEDGNEWPVPALAIEWLTVTD